MEERVRYKQLEPEERVTIASMKQQGLSGRAIARTLGRSACTVSRELLRNDSGEWGYTGAGGERVGGAVVGGVRPAGAEGVAAADPLRGKRTTRMSPKVRCRTKRSTRHYIRRRRTAAR